ncbi:MAG: hypothetical protein KDI92_00475 [Xanthomonadales bacterium]|nr:hypothetical protein [Xanthomonadales bacterium]
MKLSIEYELENAGWARLKLSNETDSYEASVSYLNDSLCELAQLAIDLKNGRKETKTIFMDEPGELHLVIILRNNLAEYEARWFEDWASWNMHSIDDYKVVLSGGTCPNQIIEQITSILLNIIDNVGMEKYKELWVEHDFPAKHLDELLNV